MMTYKWESPFDWLQYAIDQGHVKVHEIMTMLADIPGINDVIQDQFQSSMDEDGYFQEENEDDEDEDPDEDDEVCEREKDGDGWQCLHDCTGCIFNDGNNTCTAPGNSLSPLDEEAEESYPGEEDSYFDHPLGDA